MIKYRAEFFKDPVIKSRLIEIEENEEEEPDYSTITDMLETIIKLYVPEAEVNEIFPTENAKLLHIKLIEDWDIFDCEPEEVEKIVKEIIEKSTQIRTKTLHEKVVIPELYNDEFLNANAILISSDWYKFKTDLREINRFHTSEINLDLLRNILSRAEEVVYSGNIFYRARVTQNQLLENKEMGAPPSELASNGRANSKGQRCLYLASDKKNTLKEVRAFMHDYVNIASFEISEDLILLDLSALSYASPFNCTENILGYLLNEKILSQMQDDMARPMTKFDSELEYLPTQYITDFARAMGYDGIKYTSTFDKNSYNIALFSIDKAEIKSNGLYHISKMQFEYDKIAI